MKIRSPLRFLPVSLLLFAVPSSANAALDAPHNASRSVGCLSCHQMTSTYPRLLPPLGHTQQDLDDTIGNNLCWSCHNGTDAPYRATHSSLQTDGDYGAWGVECWICHSPHLQEQKFNGSTYGKFIRRSINLANISGLAKTGKKTVLFTGPTTFADGDTVYNGVCEVCHDGTGHYQGDGSSPDQNHGNIAQFGQANPGLDPRECTFCHSHQDGFRPSCPDCHGLPPTVASAGGPSGLVGPSARVPATGQLYGTPAATRSGSNGQHLLHATPSGYDYPCNTCHFGGMHTTMTADDARVDHQIQIGFSGAAVRGMSNGQDTSYNGQSALAGYSYLGTNGTTTTAGDAMTCANTYCHSNGTSVATGTIPVNTSAAWNSGPLTCDSCHEYGPGYELYAPKANSHVRHNFLGCESCHYTTTTDGTTITNTVQHANGQYDLAPSPTYYRFLTNHSNTFDYDFDAGGGTCSNISCHDGVIVTTKRWGGASLTPSSFNFNYTDQGCYGVTITDYAPSCYPPSACIPPYTYNWVFNDGYTYTSSGTSSSVSREFGAPGTYTATVTVISAKGLSGVRTSMPFDLYPPANVPPTLAITTAVNVRTVTLTDLTVDPDYNYCGHSGNAQVRIVWGDGQTTLTTIALTDQPSNQTFTHTYSTSGTKTLQYYIWDNADTWWVQLSPNPQVVVP